MKVSNTELKKKNPPGGSWGQTRGQIDMEKLTDAFQNYVNRPKTLLTV